MVGNTTSKDREVAVNSVCENSLIKNFGLENQKGKLGKTHYQTKHFKLYQRAKSCT